MPIKYVELIRKTFVNVVAMRMNEYNKIIIECEKDGFESEFSTKYNPEIPVKMFRNNGSLVIEYGAPQ